MFFPPHKKTRQKYCYKQILHTTKNLSRIHAVHINKNIIKEEVFNGFTILQTFLTPDHIKKKKKRKTPKFNYSPFIFIFLVSRDIKRPSRMYFQLRKKLEKEKELGQKQRQMWNLSPRWQKTAADKHWLHPGSWYWSPSAASWLHAENVIESEQRTKSPSRCKQGISRQTPIWQTPGPKCAKKNSLSLI